MFFGPVICTVSVVGKLSALSSLRLSGVLIATDSVTEGRFPFVFLVKTV